MSNITQAQIDQAQKAFDAARETAWRNGEALTLMARSKDPLIKSMLNAGMSHDDAQVQFHKHMKGHGEAYEKSLEHMHNTLSELRKAIKAYNAQN